MLAVSLLATGCQEERIAENDTGILPATKSPDFIAMQDIYDYERSTLTIAERNLLFEEGNKMLMENLALQSSLQTMYDKGVRIKFEIPSLMNKIASFTGSSNTIAFRSEDDMKNHRNILEELLHALQYNNYGRGYMSKIREKNLEYEVMVIMDVLSRLDNRPSTYYGLNADANEIEVRIYNGWLFQLMYTQSLDVSFNDMVRNWDDEGKCGDFDENFMPLLLIDILSSRL